MMISLATVTLALILNATAGSVGTTVTEPNPNSMSKAEIRAFNESVGKNHRYYIRCKRSAATGSFLQGSSSCRTNEQWAIAMDRGNEKARDFVESTNKAWSNGN